jgi:hypothetical protein
MNVHYLWLAGAIELLTFFVLAPAIAVAIAIAARKGTWKILNPARYGPVCVGSGVAASLLLGLAKWINADVRTPQFFLQFASFLLSGLLFGVCMGTGFFVLLRLWRWHRATRMLDTSRTER